MCVSNIHEIGKTWNFGNLGTSFYLQDFAEKSICNFLQKSET